MRPSGEVERSARMGQDSSKSTEAGRASIATQDNPPADSVVPASHSVKIHIPLAPPQRSGSFGSSIPAKRSLDEHDPRNDVLRTPLRDKFVRTSPGSHRALESDRREDRSPPRRPDGSISPDSRRRLNGDHWSPRDLQQSPPQRPVPLRRPSPARNGSSGYAEYPRPLPKSSPPRPSNSLDRSNSDSWEGRGFRNLSWKAPDLDSRALPSSNAKSHSLGTRKPSIVPDPSTGPHPTPEKAQAKVDYNGLKGVPTGPKQTPGPKAGAKPLTPVDPQVKSRPHIFISGTCVPAAQKTRPHLHKYLRSFIPQEEDIYVDETGWYLCFEDTDIGRRSLAMCFQKHDKSKLFSMYIMHMDCYPHGQPDLPPPRVNGGALDAADNDVVTSPSNEASTAAHTFLDGLAQSLSSPVENVVESAVPDSSFTGPLTSPLPLQVAIHLQRSSPLSVPSRQERDETASSISGITGSDISASKRLNCHVCQKASTFEIDQPIRCSSCPRRYHRRCHLHPAIPTNLPEDHHWQCRRCVKKQVPLKSRLSNTSAPNADFSPAASVGQPDDEPPSKRLRVDISPPDLIQEHIPSANGLVGPSIDEIRSLATEHRLASAHDLSDADDTYEPAEMPVVNSDEHNLSEANDLVAKSFACSEATAQQAVDTTRKSGKLKFNLIRKKIVRTPETNTPEGNWDNTDLSKSSATNVETPPTQQNVPAETTTAVASGNDTSKKPHRWSGGGADKEIIKAGKDDFVFQFGSPTRNNNGLPFATSKGGAGGDQDAIMEVAESPEEQRKSGIHSREDIGNERANLHRGDDTNKDAPMKPTDAVAPQPTVPPLYTQRGPSAKARMKPSTPAMSQCVKCDKKIAAMPSGNNIYCSRCKKGFSVESNASSRISGSEQRELDAEHARLESQARNAEATKEGTASHQSPVLPNSTTAHDQIQTSSTAASEPTVALDSARAAGVEVEREQDGSEGDLDFWKPKDPEPAEVNSKAKSPGPADEIQDDMEVDMDLPQANMPDDIDSDANSDTPLVEEETPQDSDRESPTADAEDSPQSKRRSQTRPAKGTYDLGDSYTRPPNTYVKLIGMALCQAPNHRLKGNDIVQWVLENVPTYKAKEGKWENSLRATMTLKRAGYGGGEGLWKIVDDGSKKNEGFTYELLPGKAETMLHWDPVLRQPISPPRGWRNDPTSKERGGDVRVTTDRSRDDTLDSTESPSKASSRRRKHDREGSDGKRLASSHREQLQLDTPDESISASTEMDRSIEDGNDSSSSEPIARMWQKAKPSLATTMVSTDVEMLDAGTSTAAHLSAEIKQLVSATVNQFTPERQPPIRSRKVTLEDMIEAEAKMVDYTAKSLFDEWPEYDPKNQIDREAKIAEIKARPTRKQKFGKQDNSIELETSGPISRYVFSDSATLPERPKRTTSRAVHAYPWEAEEENVVKCESIAELFGLPANPVAIIHEGEIAYRDGTKNYSRVIYKSGFA